MVLARDKTTRRAAPSLLRARVASGITAILVALGLWLVVHAEKSSVDYVNVPITYTHPDDIVLVGDYPKEVRLRVSAKRSRFAQLRSTDFRVEVPFGGSEGEEFKVLTPDTVDAPRGVEVEEVTPLQFRVEYDTKVVRHVRVELVTLGEPAPDHEVRVERIVVNPPKVRLTGPTRQLEHVERVPTQPVDVTGRTEGFTVRQVGVVVPEHATLEGGVATVEASIPIGPIQGTRTIDGVPVGTVNHDRRVRINPTALGVLLAGPLPSLKRLKATDVTLTVDLAGLEPAGDDYELAVQARVDPDACGTCTVQGLSPQRWVDVRIYNAPLANAPAGDGAGPAAGANGQEARASERGADRAPSGERG